MNISKLSKSNPSFGVNYENSLELRTAIRHVKENYFLCDTHSPKQQQLNEDVNFINSVYPKGAIYVKGENTSSGTFKVSLYISNPDNGFKPIRIDTFRWYYADNNDDYHRIHNVANALRRYQAKENSKAGSKK